MAVTGNRVGIVEKLLRYRGENEVDQEAAIRVLEFVEGNERCFDRDLFAGHVVGSAWVLNRARTHVLLTHHVKLGKWLQLGGHSDGDGDTLNVAYREALEESGLSEVKVVSGEIFDIDVHLYPEKERVSEQGVLIEPEHWHFDIRFLFEADDGEEIKRQEEESKEIKWVRIDEVLKLNDEEGMRRLVRKSLRLF